MVNTLDKTFVTQGSWKPDLFKGKVAFITGGSGTICRVQAEALALLGCRTALIGRNHDNLKVTSEEICNLVGDNEACFIVPNIDVREIKQIQSAVDKTLQKYGRIDFVIAGAAGNFVCDYMNLSPNAFKSVIDIDLLGSFNTVKAATPALLKSGGSVLFVSATFHYYGVPFQGPVGAAKAGIDALSNNLAVELGPLGIRSNCIAPGAIDETEGFRKLSKPELKENVKKMIPLQRLGTKRDIAEATVYLFSPAGSYVNGHVLVVDGGMWHTGTLFAQQMYPQEILKGYERAKSKL